MTFKEWPIRCPICNHRDKVLAWDYDLPITCPKGCVVDTHLDYDHKNSAPGVATDDLPGGYEVRHGAGLINPDGSPKKYYSKTDLKRACNEHNWTIAGDTPKPYKVNWDGKRKDEFAPKES